MIKTDTTPAKSNRAKPPKPLSSAVVYAAFREELNLVLPGYKWTVNTKRSNERYIIATGIQSSGFNRLSTIEIVKEGSYRAKISGHGTKAEWMGEGWGQTLKQCVRSLQSYMEHQGRVYIGLANSINSARVKPEESNRLVKEYCGNQTSGGECGLLGHQCPDCKKGNVVMSDPTIKKAGFRTEHYPVNSG